MYINICAGARRCINASGEKSKDIKQVFLDAYDCYALIEDFDMIEKADFVELLEVYRIQRAL